MALAALLASAAHASLADPIKGEYRPASEDEVKANPNLKDHFILDVTPANGYGLDNLETMRTTISREKGRADRAESKVTAFGDLKPDEVQTKLDKLAQLETLDPVKEADKIAQAKIDAAKVEMANANKADLDKERSRADRYRGTLDRTLRQDQARAAIVEAGGSPEALLPHILNSTKFTETDDGKFNVQVIDSEGNPRIGDAAGGAMTLKQLVDEFKAKDAFAPLFQASGATGGGTGAAGGGGAPPAAGLKKSAMSLNDKAEFIEKHGQEAFLRLAA